MLMPLHTTVIRIFVADALDNSTGPRTGHAALAAYLYMLPRVSELAPTMQWSPSPPLPSGRLGPSHQVERHRSTGRATRVPQGTNGMQRTVTVTPTGSVGCTCAPDLGRGEGPETACMQRGQDSNPLSSSGEFSQIGRQAGRIRSGV
jgi:hypothetical protein